MTDEDAQRARAIVETVALLNQLVGEAKNGGLGVELETASQGSILGQRGSNQYVKVTFEFPSDTLKGAMPKPKLFE